MGVNTNVEYKTMEELNSEQLSQLIENQKAHIIGETNLLARNRMVRGLMKMYEQYYNLDIAGKRNIKFMKEVMEVKDEK